MKKTYIRAGPTNLKEIIILKLGNFTNNLEVLETGKDKDMTFKELIERLYKQGNGGYKVLEDFIQDYKTKTNFTVTESGHSKIFGFLWGLYSANFISDSERSDLIDKLIHHNIDD